MNEFVEILLSLATLLFLSIGTFLLSQRIKAPYTVLLVLVGLLLVPIVNIPAFSYITSFELTPELLFFIFLPTLIFESAYNINIRKIGESSRSIATLSIISLLISVFFVAFAGNWLFGAIGFEVPFIILLLFGALISSTDPVAVLSLFKEFGAPRKLLLIFEGESLFNDGTAMAFFLVLLEIMLAGYHGATSITSGVLLFLQMVLGGVLFGLFMGTVFSKMLQYARHEHLQITITMLAAHLTFLLTELLSHTIHIGGFTPHFSSIIATVVASMVIGSYGRIKISPNIHKYMDHFWSYFAFVANSIIFILLGLLFATLPLRISDIIIPLFIIIGVVIVARAVSIYPIIGLLNKVTTKENIPLSWQHLMAWGSLRGAIAVTMVLLIPDNLSHPDWNHAYTIKEFILALTIGCIYFTLFIKATSIPAFIKRLHLDELHDLEKAEYQESKVYLAVRSLMELKNLKKRKLTDEETYLHLFNAYTNNYQKALTQFASTTHHSEQLFERALRLHTIGVEKKRLRELYACGEITEIAYRKISRKLELQTLCVENGSCDIPSFEELSHEHHTPLFQWMLNIIYHQKKSYSPEERFIYYRALSVIAHTVLEDLTHIFDEKLFPILDHGDIIIKIFNQYRSFDRGSNQKLQELIQENPSLTKDQVYLTKREILKSQLESLDHLLDQETITPKLHTLLTQECREDIDKDKK